MTKIATFALFILLAVNSYAQNDSIDNPAIYAVKAEISELKNRTLECKVRDHTVFVDQPKVFGADDLGPTPPEMLAIAYGSCVVSTMQLLALQRNLTITDIFVEVEGHIDFSKALGISNTNRAGFSGLNLKIRFDSDMIKSEKESFINDVLKIGAAIDNVDNPTPVKYEITD
ncbi:OsmC family protein [Dysgonomonas macrotermitis]|uniref:OsmC-like protein n=1 Tax=Dysgonomonas macrotermitis TaxID=1346286 RepID=A0A1M4W045_9BACT|nr:OsmC family protein [Dysgonomonas macrotermitis]SHE74520.1 OsmC-like protein [Dysgonomonas macrotermitis]